MSANIVVFLNTAKKMSFFNFTQLKQQKRTDLKFIALVKKGEKAQFDALPEALFDEITEVPDSEVEMGLDFKASAQLLMPYKDQILAISCNSEDNLLLAARLRKTLNVPGLDESTATSFRDKVVMKQTLAHANVRVPKFGRLKKGQSESGYFDTIAESVGLPFIIKPTSELGSTGVALIHSYEEFLTYQNKMAEQGEYEYEEFIQGSLFHVDGVLNNGELLFHVACEYTNPNYEFTQGHSVISMPLKPSAEKDKLTNFAINAVQALGLKNGVFHLEVFNKGGELVFLEVAARAPGAVVIPMYEKQFGVNLLNYSLAVELGVAPFPVGLEKEQYYFCGILPNMAGTIENIESPILHSQFKMKSYVAPGETLSAASNLRDICASIEVANDDYDALRLDFEMMRRFNPLVMSN